MSGEVKMEIDFASALRDQRATPAEESAVAETPPQDQLRQDAHRFGDMIIALQDSERRANAERNLALARAEQMQSVITDLRSQLETARLHVEEARQQTDIEKAERIRLAAVIEMLITQASAAIKQP